MDLRKRKITIKAGIIFAVVAIIACLVAFFLTADTRAGVKKGDYQLVTLTTGERYIGRLSGVNQAYFTLTNVYFQQEDAASEASAENQSKNITVVKLSSSVAKPEDILRISKDQVAHWTNLQNDSKIVQAIKSDGQQ